MSANIKVLVRVRPLDESKKEKWATGMEIHGRRITLGPKTFDPDVTLSCESTQEDVFDHCLPIIESVKNGSNGTILVYGQTGTGKTHTMLGPDNDYSGIAFFAIDNLLTYVRDKVMIGGRASVTLSMLEIYNEKITDMLTEEQIEVQLYGGFPHTARKVSLSTMEGAINTVRKGLTFRHVSHTAMNDRSSRSHVLLLLHLEEMQLQSDSEQVDVTRLFLVDLAGSESLKKSQATGKVAGEAGCINKSLLALKSVVLALSNTTEATRSHIPYRDSRLTEMLQDSIGGTARTMMIACISPVGRDVEETKSTLDYASKARTIRNVSNTERDKLIIRLRSLEIDNQKYRNQVCDKMSERGGLWISKEDWEQFTLIEEDNLKLKNDVEQLTYQLEQAVASTNIITSQTEIYKSLLNKKEDELQEVKNVQLQALLKLERATAEMQRKMVSVLGETERATEREFANQSSIFSQFVNEQLCPAAIVAKFSDRVDAICACLNRNLSDTATSLKHIHNESLRQINEEKIRLKQVAINVGDRLNRLLTSEVDAMRHEVGSVCDNIDSSIETSSNLFDTYLSKPFRADPSIIHNLLSDVVGDLENVAEEVRPSRTMPVILSTEFSRSRENIRCPVDDVLMETFRNLGSVRSTTAGLDAFVHSPFRDGTSSQQQQRVATSRFSVTSSVTSHNYFSQQQNGGDNRQSALSVRHDTNTVTTTGSSNNNSIITSSSCSSSALPGGVTLSLNSCLPPALLLKSTTGGNTSLLKLNINNNNDTDTSTSNTNISDNNDNNKRVSAAVRNKRCRSSADDAKRRTTLARKENSLPRLGLH